MKSRFLKELSYKQIDSYEYFNMATLQHMCIIAHIKLKYVLLLKWKIVESSFRKQENEIQRYS
jgi:hypothetical protein